jgi:outer membrane protein assembly factor BamB
VVGRQTINGDGVLYLSANLAGVYAMDSADGSVLWQFQTQNAVQTTPALAADGSLYVGANDGHLYSLKGSGHLAASSWPMNGHDPQHTNRARP